LGHLGVGWPGRGLAEPVREEDHWSGFALESASPLAWSPVVGRPSGPTGLAWWGRRCTVGVGSMTGQTTLRGRDPECAALDRLLDATRRGESRTLVIRGEPGVGKTALLDYTIGSAPDLRVLRAVGVESEMELAFASLQQLCSPTLDRLERLPGPQQDALGVALGLRAGRTPDRFLVGLAALSLLSEAAEERPLLCAFDDAQWLDEASAVALAFVARRLLAEPVAIVFVTREPMPTLSGLPELVLDGVGDDDAQLLLASAMVGPLDERVRETFIAETRGNPLALLELPRTLTRRSLPEGSRSPRHSRWRTVSSRASSGGFGRSRLVRNNSCSRLRRSRSATSPYSGARPSDSRSEPTRSGRPRPPA
jgi:AAA ATPase domain